MLPYMAYMDPMGIMLTADGYTNVTNVDTWRGRLFAGSSLADLLEVHSKGVVCLLVDLC